MRLARLFVTFTTLLLLVPFFCEAKKNKREKYARKPPKAVLVMLFTESNRREALIRAGRFSDTAQLNKDMLMVRNSTIRDFTDNFNYCPVYYYFDKDQEAIMAKNFEGVLRNSSLAPVQAQITDTNFLIVYYGFPGWQSHKNKWEVTTMTDVGSKPNGWGLVIDNHEMKQVAYTYWLRSIVNRKGKLRGYKYISPKFDIEYFPLATELDHRLKRYAQRRREVLGAEE